MAADGVGNLLSGLFATVPNTTYSNSVSIVDITGIAARRVGVCIGLIFIALAFFPKAAAVLLAIPDPVVGAYIVVLIAILFVLGLEMVAQDGIDYRKATIIGVSFWVGAGFQSGQIPSDYFGWAGPLLENGMTSGGLTAILLSTFMELSGPRRRRIETTLNVEAQPKIHEFLERFAARAKLSEETANRVSLAAEETLLVLLDQIEEDGRPRGAAAAGDRQSRVRRRRAGVPGGGRRRQHRGPHGLRRHARGGDAGGAGLLAAAAAARGHFRASPEVPRHGHRVGAGGGRGGVGPGAATASADGDRSRARR